MARLTKCQDCGGKVSKKAKTCPHCGAKVKKKTSLLTWLIAIILVPILFSAIFRAAQQPTTYTAPTQPTVAITENSTPSDVKGWEPDKACDFLSDKGYQTRGYKDLEGIYGCVGDWVFLSEQTETKLPNNLAYHVDGTRDTATVLKLNLNINQKELKTESLTVLSDVADVLAMQAVNRPLTSEIKEALSAGNAGEWDLGGAKVKLLKRSKDTDKVLNYLYTIEKK